MAIEDMKGKPGRPKGSRNKITTEIKDAILMAFDEVGGVEYLTKVAQEEPRVFCGLLAKILPKDMHITTEDQFAHLSDEELHTYIVEGMRKDGYVVMTEEEAKEAGVLNDTQH